MIPLQILRAKTVGQAVVVALLPHQTPQAALETLPLHRHRKDQMAVAEQALLTTAVAVVVAQAPWVAMERLGHRRWAETAVQELPQQFLVRQ